MTGVYQEHGIRFQYPNEWAVEINDDGPVTTVALQPAGGLAFALVTLDREATDAEVLADQALEAMREEYPDLSATPAGDSICGKEAVGHNVEFTSLDMNNLCSIRCFRSRDQTVLVFAQWSELDEDDFETSFGDLRRSFAETD
ncbi:MAG: hypothetical protein KGM43_13690 [Planctomycetota bacterium]|nr:hypothetical protein [Planctomycetota bacterium]